MTIKDEGFVEGVIENTEGDKVTVKVRKYQKQFMVSSILSETNDFLSLISAIASRKWLIQKDKGTLLCLLV